MGFLIPEITKPVRIELTADEAKREAIGRVLAMTGAGFGILGGLMLLAANPAIRAAVANKKGIAVTMQPQQAKQYALGKSIAVIGTAVATGGSLMVMSSSPQMKAQFAQNWQRVPASIRENKKVVTLGFLGLIVAGAAYLVNQQKQQFEAQMAKG